MFNRDQLQGWFDEDTVEYYKHHRSTYSELYPSEKYYITADLIKGISSVLDIGCAVGGFYRIFRSLNEQIRYVGVDVSEKSIAIAQEKYADYEQASFYLYSGEALESIQALDGNRYDLVYCSGLMHAIDNWRDLFAEIVSKAKRYIIVDFRLSLKRDSYTGEFHFDFDDDGHSRHSTNYHVINLNRVIRFLKEFDEIASVGLYGYRGQANQMARNIDEVYMVFFKIEMGNRAEGRLMINEIPDEFCPYLSDDLIR
jgi:SAM-dependent methyltransferase